MKRLTAVLTLLIGMPVLADVAEVRLFTPEPGRANELYQAGLEAKAIQEKAGANVYVGVDQHGTMHYANSFPNWEAWAKFGEAMQASAAWNAFFSKFSANPSGTQSGVFYLNTPVVAEDKQVALVYVWDVQPGKGAQMMTNAQEAAAIHTKLGASVGIHFDDIGNMYYEMQFDSWAAWAKYTAAIQQNEAWAAFIAKANQDPVAELVNVFRLDAVTASQ